MTYKDLFDILDDLLLHHPDLKNSLITFVDKKEHKEFFITDVNFFLRSKHIQLTGSKIIECSDETEETPF